MNISRIYQPVPLSENTEITLDDRACHYVGRVLRGQKQDALTLFNGRGGEYSAVITAIDKKNTVVRVEKLITRTVESPLNLLLAQGISRGEKMDFTIQKAVELGVKKIAPLFTERCQVRLDADRQEKRMQHWQSIIISACEQCGRNELPELLPPQELSVWLATLTTEACFVLSPHTAQKLSDLAISPTAAIVLLIGPEGGLSESEIQKVMTAHFLPLNLGPRILRTETAAVAAITALQVTLGDMR